MWHRYTKPNGKLTSFIPGSSCEDTGSPVTPAEDKKGSHGICHTDAQVAQGPTRCSGACMDGRLAGVTAPHPAWNDGQRLALRRGKCCHLGRGEKVAQLRLAPNAASCLTSRASAEGGSWSQSMSTVSDCFLNNQPKPELELPTPSSFCPYKLRFPSKQK